MILRGPWTQGGLACLDLQKYYYAALLSYAHNWVISDDTNASVVLEAAFLGSYESLRNVLYYRGPQAPFHLTLSENSNSSMASTGLEAPGRNAQLVPCHSLMSQLITF